MRQPSVLGGVRPVVRDDGQMAFRRVMSLRADVKKAREKLESLENQLADAELERAEFLADCGHCGDCSACIG